MDTSFHFDIGSVAHAKSNSLGHNVLSPLFHRVQTTAHISAHHAWNPLFVEEKYFWFIPLKKTFMSIQASITSDQYCSFRFFRRYWAAPVFSLLATHISREIPTCLAVLSRTSNCL